MLRGRQAGSMAARICGAWVVVGVCLAVVGAAHGLTQVKPAGSSVSLPYVVQDTKGGTWTIYQNGTFQQQSGQPLYMQAAQLLMNNSTPNTRSGTARLDPRTRELVLEEMTGGAGLVVTRRVWVNREEGYIRYVDIVRNTTGQEAAVTLQVQSSSPYGVMGSERRVADPRNNNRQIAWIGGTPVQRAMVEVFAGKGASGPAVTARREGNSVQIVTPVKIPAGKEVAMMHLHATVESADAGEQWVLGLKDSAVMANVDPAVRRLIVNWRAGGESIGGIEVVRGETSDVLETRSGDQLKGTIQEKSFELATFFGKVTLPAERVVAMMNVGSFRPRQLLVTADGQVFGGQLQKSDIKLELSSGQVSQIPLTQIVRAGYRMRPGEVADANAVQRPMVFMSSGDRVGVELPAEEIEVATRYGSMKLKPEAVAAIVLQSDGSAVHEVQLTDGSHFAGLALAAMLPMKLSETGQVVQFPLSAVTHLQLNASKAQRADEKTMPMLSLANDDLLVGSLQGTLKLDTAYDTLTMNAAEIKQLRPSTSDDAPTGGLEMQVTLWDETTVSGQLQQSQLDCALLSGVKVQVPVGLVKEYKQPAPQVSTSMVERIKAIVADLDAEDWKRRDQAEAQLVAMGSSVVAVLKEMRANASPEGQQRIDSILKQVTKPDEKAGGQNPGAKGPWRPSMPATLKR